MLLEPKGFLLARVHVKKGKKTLGQLLETPTAKTLDTVKGFLLNSERNLQYIQAILFTMSTYAKAVFESCTKSRKICHHSTL